jgi:prepilin-type N-terminal cleavage/methylation domain-containing protein
MNRGMTLLELVIGITVTGLALSAGFGALTMLGDRRQRMDAAMDEVAHAATVRADIAHWIGGAHLLAEEGGPNFRGLDGVKSRIPDDELTFLTTAPTPLGTGETIVRIYVDRDSGTGEQGLTAAFAEWRGAGVGVTRVELAPRVVGIDARYLSGVMGGGRPVWLSSWISSTLLPAGVELRFYSAPRDTLPPLLRLPIHVPFRSGQ